MLNKKPELPYNILTARFCHMNKKTYGKMRLDAAAPAVGCEFDYGDPLGLFEDLCFPVLFLPNVIRGS